MNREERFDKINDILNKMSYNRQISKFKKLKDIKSKNENIFRNNIALEEINEENRPRIKKKEGIVMQDIYEECFQNNNNKPYCNTIKEFYKSIEQKNEMGKSNNTPPLTKRPKKEKEINEIVKKRYYSEYYENII